jgi:hypothetical protein
MPTLSATLAALCEDLRTSRSQVVANRSETRIFATSVSRRKGNDVETTARAKDVAVIASYISEARYDLADAVKKAEAQLDAASRLLDMLDGPTVIHDDGAEAT